MENGKPFKRGRKGKIAAIETAVSAAAGGSQYTAAALGVARILGGHATEDTVFAPGATPDPTTNMAFSTATDGLTCAVTHTAVGAVRANITFYVEF